MPDQKDPLGILGDSTKQQKDPLGILTGEPVKKKEIGGFGSIAGGLIGTGGDGRSVSSRLVSGTIKTVKPVEKVEIAGIEDYNKNFRETTGVKAEEFNLGSDLPQIKKAREEKKYLQYRDIEENELKPVVNAVRTGTASPKQLQELYSQPYGRKVVSDVIKSELPELADIGGLDPEIVNSGEKWQEISKRLQEKNRPAGVEAQNQSEFALDNELDNTFKNFTYGKEELIEGARRGDPRQLKETKIPFGDVNTTSPTDLMAVLDRIGNMPYVFDASGNRKSTKELKEKIQERIFQLKSTEQINPEIYGNKEIILDAVSKVPVEWKRKGGDNPDLTNKDAEYFMQGLNYIRDLQPGRYGIIMGAIEKTGKIAETDFTELASMGKTMQYFRDFKEGKYVEPDERSLITPQIKQANLAGWLSERLKQMGKSKRAAVPQKDILEAYNDAPEELKDEELLRNIINKERAPAFGFLPIAKGEGITKTGRLPSFMRGIAEPFQAVQNTIEVGFDSPYDAYLKSKKYDRGQQLIPQKGGGYGNVLPSEKFWNKASAGFGSFMSQLFLARGFGAAVKTPINAVIGRVNPMAAITSRDAALKFGTPLSTLSQTYGDEFIDFLEKTGSPVKAGLGAFVSGYTQGIIEKNIMPDVLIAEKASLLLAKKNLAKEIIKVVDNGGGKVGVANAVKDFIVNTTKTIGKEAWLEENLQNLTNVMTEAIISPQTVKDRNVLKETIDTGNAATVMMLIPSLLGGAGETKAKRSLTKSQLNAIAADPKKYIESINNQYSLGQITEQERELALNIINVQRDNILSSPVRDANGDLISAERQLEYAYQSTVQQIAKEQASKITDPIQLEPIEKKIEEADKIKRQIFYGEENKELPPKEGGKVSINQDRDLMDEETDESEFVSRPKEEILVDVPTAADAIQDENVRQNIIANPEQGLAEIAQQLHSTEGEASTATKVFGRDLSDLALEMYPTREAADEALQKQSAVSVQMPGEVSKPQTTEIKPAETQSSEVLNNLSKSDRETGTIALFESGLSIEEGEQLVEEIKNGNVTVNNLHTRLNVPINTLFFAKKLLTEGKLADALGKAIEIKKSQKETVIDIEEQNKKSITINEKFINELKQKRDSEDFKYIIVEESDVLGNRKKVKRLKTKQELEESTKKINDAINKAEKENEKLKLQLKEQPKPAEPIEEDMTAFVKVTRPELGFEELPTDILDNMDSKTMAVQGKRLEGLNKNLSKLQELFNCIWT